MKARVVSFDDCEAMVNKGAKTQPHTNHSLINMSSALSALKAQDSAAIYKRSNAAGRSLIFRSKHSAVFLLDGNLDSTPELLCPAFAGCL